MHFYSHNNVVQDLLCRSSTEPDVKRVIRIIRILEGEKIVNLKVDCNGKINCKYYISLCLLSHAMHKKHIFNN